MKIGVIGSGRIGANAALLFAKAGHQVAISNSRGPQSLTELIQQIGPNVKAMTADEAVSFGEVILNGRPIW